MNLLTLLLPAAMPAIADAIRALVGKVTGTGGGQPANATERIALMDADTRRLQALAELDKPAANISPWVADLRASFRYLAVLAIIAATVAAVFVKIEAAALLVLLDLTGACMSFIIGERMYLALKK